MHISPSGKRYIGITRRRPSKRFDGGRGYQHSPHMKAAIEKYGWENFAHVILASGLTQLEAELDEVSYIAVYHTTDPSRGYNVTSGGKHAGEITPEARSRLSERMKSEQNPVYRFGGPMAGKKHTEEAKRKMSEAAKKRHVPCSETRRLALRHAHSYEKRAVLCIETGKTFEGIHEAAEAHGLMATKICAVCKGKRHTTGGFHWEYAE
jgi:group I intron endonuclease